MKIIPLLALSLLLSSCVTPSTPVADAPAAPADGVRAPATNDDLSGAHLGEGLFSAREDGLKRPAVRLYLNRAEGEADTYYAVLFEYTDLLKMSVPYLATEKASAIKLNELVGYLNEIGTHIEAFKVVPGAKANTYNMHTLFVQNGRIVPATAAKLLLSLNPKSAGISGAVITGNKDGNIVFPGDTEKPKGVFGKIGELLTLTQYEMASIAYSKGHLASTWRGNWNDLEGSYLSVYGKLKDGVHELYTENGHRKVKFMKSQITKAKKFTNPKSFDIVGDYLVSEPVPKMYILTPPPNRARTASDVEMTGRIGLFLDVFDGSAPAAGGHMVTELVYTNPRDPEDYMMYYEHPQHLKNVGVSGK